MPPENKFFPHKIKPLEQKRQLEQKLELFNIPRGILRQTGLFYPILLDASMVVSHWDNKYGK